MALNPPSSNPPKGQAPRSGAAGEKSARASAPPAVGAGSGSASSGLGPEDPKQIGKYEIQKKLGSGGMGTVYLALDSQLKRQVALKLLPREKAENPNLVKRFHAEAQSAANLRHENIVTVYEAGEADGYLFMALEFIDGVDTAELISRRGVVPAKRSIEIVRQVLKALDHAYSKKIVHRDIKPANLLIRRDGLVKLTDLGLARSREDPLESGITRAGTTVGTIDYMSPEQARDSKSADVRSDLYSLGCTWYYLLTGEAPFPEGNLTNKLRAHFETPFPDPRLKNQSVPEGVVAVMRRMTEKDPRSRYQTPSDVLEDLDQSNTSRSMSPEVTLGNLVRDEETAAASGVRRGGRSSTAVPPVHLPPAPHEKLKMPGRMAEESQSTERDYRSMAIYGGILLVAVAAVGGLGWIVKTFSSTFDAPRQANMVDIRTRKDLPPPVENVPSKTPADPAAQPGNTQTPETKSPETRSNSNTKPGKQVAKAITPPAEQTPELPQVLEAPRWVSEILPPPTSLVRVSLNPRGIAEAATVHEAIQKMPADGGVVELNGPGPFILRNVDVADKTRIVLQGGEGSSVPLVLLLPSEGLASNKPVLNLRGTHLELRGLQFAAAGDLFRPLPESLICVRNGNLLVERCTFTVSGGTSAAPLVALKVIGDQGRAAPLSEPAHVLVDQTLFRGPHLTSLATDVSHADIVVRNSYVWAGAAPALRIEAPGKNLVAGARLGASLLHSTIASQTCGLEIARSAVDGPLQNSLGIGLVESVLATPAVAGSSPKSKGNAALCSLAGWNKENARAALGKNFTWQSVRSLYLGWDRLIELPLDGSVVATSYPEWRNLFAAQKQPSSAAAQFQAARWPAQVPADASKLIPASLSLDVLGDPFVKASNGGWPGATPESLVPSDASDALASAADVPMRPPFQEGLLARGDSTTLRVDLMKEDLGKAIAGLRLRTGMTVVASGNNRHLCTPFTIDGVWVHLKFEQTDGPPLILTPRGPGANRGSGALSDDALISVRSGGLELSNAAFDAPTDDRKPIPRWYVQGLNSDLVLRNCRIEGPMTSGGTNLGVVQWLRNGAGTPNRSPDFPHEADAYLVIQESYLSGSGSVVQADMSRRSLFARNSVMVARDTLFNLRAGTGDSANGGTVDVERCTFSAAGHLFRIDGAAAPLDSSTPMQLFADRCVFAPPVKIGERTAGCVMLASPAAILSRRQVRWGESYCGYASEISRFLQSSEKPGDTGETLGFRDWEKKWGPLRVVSPLLGRDGVKLAEALPDRRKLEPGSFRLQRNCDAMTWAPYGNLIGADVRTMNVPETRPSKSAGSGSSGTTKGTSPGSKTKPGPPLKGAPPKIEKGF